MEKILCCFLIFCFLFNTKLNSKMICTAKVELECFINNGLIDQYTIETLKNSSFKKINLDFNGRIFNQINIKEYTKFDKILNIRNLSGFELDPNWSKTFLSFFKEIHIYESNFEFFIYNNLPLSIDKCNNKYTRMFRSPAKLYIHGSVKFKTPICPLIFYNSVLNVLYLENLTLNNSLRFQNINYFQEYENVYILKLVINQSHFRLDNDLINWSIFCKIKRLEIYGSRIESIEQNIFQNLSSLTVFYIENFSSLLHKNFEWLSNLNKAYFYDSFDDCYQVMRDVKIRSIKIQKFFLILNDSNNDYDYPDNDFCLFQKFPHQNFVFPIIYTKKSLNCTCTLIWLLLNWKLANYYGYDYDKEILINTTSVSECLWNFNKRTSECKFENRLKKCNIERNLKKFWFRCDINKRYYQIKCVETLIYLFLFFSIGLIGLFLDILSLYILKDRDFKENMYSYMRIQKCFEIISLLTLFFHFSSIHSIDYFFLLYSTKCDLDFRSHDFYLSLFKIYLINFVTNSSITSASLANLLMIFDRYLYTTKSSRFKNFTQMKKVNSIAVPLIILISGLTHIYVFLYCNINGCIFSEISFRLRYSISFIQDVFYIIITVIGFFLNISLTRFLILNGKNKSNLIKNKKQKSFIKLKVLVVTSCSLILLARIPNIIENFYKIRFLTNFRTSDSLVSLYSQFLIATNLSFILSFLENLLLSKKFQHKFKKLFKNRNK